MPGGQDPQADLPSHRRGPRDLGGGFAALLPIALFLLAFYMYPLVRMIYLAFDGRSPSLRHFEAFFQNDTYVNVLVFTVVMSIVVTVVSLIVGYPVAYALATTSPRLRGLLFVVILVPWLVPELVRNFTWLVILQSNSVLTKFQGLLGLGSEPILPIGSLGAVLIGMVYVQLPLAVLPMYVVMQRLDFTLLTVASTLGAPPLKVVSRILIPLTMPGVAAAAILAFLTTLGFYITPLILGGGRHSFMANLIDIQVSKVVNWEFGSALSVVLVVAGLGIASIGSRIIGWRWLIGTDD